MSAVEPGRCLMHGYHGQSVCPKCSSSVAPVSVLMPPLLPPLLMTLPSPPTFTSTTSAICPDLLRLELIGEADGLRGRIVRWFFLVLDRLMPVA